MEIKFKNYHERKLLRISDRYNLKPDDILEGLFVMHLESMNKSKSIANFSHNQIVKFTMNESDHADLMLLDDFLDYCQIIQEGKPDSKKLHRLGEILIWEKEKGVLLIGTDVNDLHLSEIEKIAKSFKIDTDFITIEFFQRKPRLFNICKVVARSNGKSNTNS